MLGEQLHLLAQEYSGTGTYEAVKGPAAKAWMIAVNKELDAHERNNTWKIVPRKPGMKTIGSRWGFKVIPDADHDDPLFKARLCALGYMQQEGKDYTETFAPVVRYDSLRILLSFVAYEDLEMLSFDVSSAFLHGELEEEIYMEVPEGVIVEANNSKSVVKSENENVVCKLVKALYGLKQAPRCWNVRFKQFLNKFKFKECDADHCIFVGQYNGYDVYLALFVDDGLLACKSQNVLLAILTELQTEFSITTGDASYFVGLQISRDRKQKSMFLNQNVYVSDILNRFRMTDAKAVSVPADPHVTLHPAESEDESAHNVPY